MDTGERYPLCRSRAANSYRPDTPRVALALAAAALCVLTLSVLVVAPAQFDAREDRPLVLAAPTPATPVSRTAVACSSSRVEPRATRAPNADRTPEDPARPICTRGS